MSKTLPILSNPPINPTNKSVIAKTRKESATALSPGTPYGLSSSRSAPSLTPKPETEIGNMVDKITTDLTQPIVIIDERDKAVLHEQMRRIEESTPPKIERNWRMAHCATVTVHGAEGRALHTIRYGRMPPTPGSTESFVHREVKRLMERLRDDVIALRAQRPELCVVLLADGAPELWNLFEQHLNKRTLGVEPMRLVDAWHALEHVAAAARFLETRRRVWPGSFRRWKDWLLNEPDGAQRVLTALEQAGLHRARDDNGNRLVGDAIRYMQSRLTLMRYAEAQLRGLPIGSGAVEATCKSLVSLKMKRPGSRWKPESGNEVLQLRALQLSDRWEPAVTRTLRPLRKPVHVISRQEALRKAA